MIKILHFEDLAEDAKLVEQELERATLVFERIVVKNITDFENTLYSFLPDIILSGHSLPIIDSIEALSMVRNSDRDIPFILVTATMSEEFAITLLRLGMDDCILKDNLVALPSAIQQALEKYIALRAKSKAGTDLAITHERLLFHLENSPLGYVKWDSENRSVTWSKKSEEIFGWTLEEYTRESEVCFGRIYAEDLRWMKAIVKKLLNGSIVSNIIQCRHYRKDKKVIWCEWYNSVLKGTEGQVITILSRAQDITERKKAEQALIDNEFRIGKFFETGPEAMLVIDADSGGIVDLNNNALHLFKYPAEELLTKTFLYLSPLLQLDGKSSAEKIKEHTEKAKLGEKPIFQWVHCDSNDKEIFCEVKLSLLSDGDEPLLQASIFEVTDRGVLDKNTLEEKIKKQREIARAIVAGQEQERTLLGQELHDNINQILATSKLYIDFLISSKEVRKDLMTESRDLLVSAMEEIRKLSKSLLPPSLGEVSLESAIDELIANIVQVHRLIFIKDWDIPDETLLSGNLKLALYRIVQEQLNNILKYANAEKVTIALKQQSDTLLLTVKDDGIGFDTATTSKGAGFKNISSRTNTLNGEAVINSTPGAGCELHVKFNI